ARLSAQTLKKINGQMVNYIICMQDESRTYHASDLIVPTANQILPKTNITGHSLGKQ
ncbi:26148_t:CDS:1, partial [Gigaspora rosea]